MATISSRDATLSSPFANVFSVSDGASIANSSGVPYFYISTWELSAKDLKVSWFLRMKCSNCGVIGHFNWCYVSERQQSFDHNVVGTEPLLLQERLGSRGPQMRPLDFNWESSQGKVPSLLSLYFIAIDFLNIKILHGFKAGARQWWRELCKRRPLVQAPSHVRMARG